MTHREFKAKKKRLMENTFFHRMRMVEVAIKTLFRSVIETWKFNRLLSKIIKESKKSK